MRLVAARARVAPTHPRSSAVASEARLSARSSGDARAFKAPGTTQYTSCWRGCSRCTRTCPRPAPPRCPSCSAWPTTCTGAPPRRARRAARQRGRRASTTRWELSRKSTPRRAGYHPHRELDTTHPHPDPTAPPSPASLRRPLHPTASVAASSAAVTTCIVPPRRRCRAARRAHTQRELAARGEPLRPALLHRASRARRRAAPPRGAARRARRRRRQRRRGRRALLRRHWRARAGRGGGLVAGGGGARGGGGRLPRHARER